MKTNNTKDQSIVNNDLTDQFDEDFFNEDIKQSALKEHLTLTIKKNAVKDFTEGPLKSKFPSEFEK